MSTEITHQPVYHVDSLPDDHLDYSIIETADQVIAHLKKENEELKKENFELKQFKTKYDTLAVTLGLELEKIHT